MAQAGDLDIPSLVIPGDDERNRNSPGSSHRQRVHRILALLGPDIDRAELGLLRLQPLFEPLNQRLRLAHRQRVGEIGTDRHEDAVGRGVDGADMVDMGDARLRLEQRADPRHHVEIGALADQQSLGFARQQRRHRGQDHADRDRGPA
ncbi:conserved hypothetical protein, partial [Ricinus communis]